MIYHEQRDDGVYGYNPVTDTYHKVSDTKPLTTEQRIAAQVEEEMREKRAKEARAIALEAAVSAREDAEYEAARLRERRRQMALDEQRERDARKAKEEESSRRYEAVVAARERYEAKSPLYRFFHKDFYKSVIGKTADQINDLYGGIEENKGRSR